MSQPVETCLCHLIFSGIFPFMPVGPQVSPSGYKAAPKPASSLLLFLNPPSSFSSLLPPPTPHSSSSSILPPPLIILLPPPPLILLLLLPPPPPPSPSLPLLVGQSVLAFRKRTSLVSALKVFGLTKITILGSFLNNNFKVGNYLFLFCFPEH